MSASKALSLLARTNRLVSTLKSSNVQLTSNSGLRNGRVGVYSASWARHFSSENSAQKERQGDTDSGATQNDKDVIDATKKLTQEIEMLTTEVADLKEKRDELLDKYKRALAESENLRIRLTKQISDAKVFGIQSFCKDLLEVADILGHATDAVPQEQIKDNNPHLKNLYEGLVMTKASLLQVFKRHGLEPVNPLNEKFDPNMHEALFEKDEPNVAPSTVVAVTKLGYKLHERCIRPALVGVSKS